MFTYWVRRASHGGPVALPADPEQPVQIIDSRDLARLVVQLLGTTSGDTGTISTSVPATSAQVSMSAPSVGGSAGPTALNAPGRSSMAGMPATPLEVTAADVLAWDRERGEPSLWNGFSPTEEHALLAQQGR
ncbi:hypothetical protein MTP10_33695 [Nonomuraea sp. 3-1Str]|uniref:hypothetical protein n=1 Tax=Nonomuraea sp. 3-1Str TaxID=2929801 RepID=UPI00286108FB|nr:hypothetical protein [Nonomuraea sp. 3-1Str]MDR8413675.1 hypothetical protein [Nonomuraea sp. 3-1Str]